MKLALTLTEKLLLYGGDYRAPVTVLDRFDEEVLARLPPEARPAASL